MSRTIPLDQRGFARIRILVRQRWSDGGDPQVSGANWEALPEEGTSSGPIGRTGYRLLDCERAALPQIGRARFACRFGRINGQIITGRELTHYEVRIQGAADRDDPDWETIWWGTVEQQVDTAWPGSPQAAGDRVYECVDAIYRTSRWLLNRHGLEVTKTLEATQTTASLGYNLVGHPGYNVASDGTQRVLGNRSSTQWPTAGGGGVQADYHTPPGGALWDDAQALTHALASARPAGEPLFTLTGDQIAQLLGSTVAWETPPGTSVLDLMLRMCRRERGLGLLFSDWEESDPDGPLTARLRVENQNAFAVTWRDPSNGTAYTIDGSSETVEVDLVGDHRNVDQAFRMSDKEKYRLDGLETVGEPIEVLATLAYVDSSLERGWSAGFPGADQETFLTADFESRTGRDKYLTVYNLHRLPILWNGIVGDGDGFAGERADYRCADAGTIVIPGTPLSTSDADQPTSTALIEIMSDLPLFAGYTYAGATPARRDGRAEQGQPQRLPFMPMLRVSTNRYIALDEDDRFSMASRVTKAGVLLTSSDDANNGWRAIADTTDQSLRAVWDYQDLVFTVGLRLPHRARILSGDPNGRRRQTIYQRDHHLWIAHPDAIWQLDTELLAGLEGHVPTRGACRYLRDDRTGLAYRHAQAWSWYGQPRETAQWALRDCGLLTSYEAYPTLGLPDPVVTPLQTYLYPKLGQIITSLAANGTTYTPNTPITRIHYDHEQGITTWSSDWTDLDFQ